VIEILKQDKEARTGRRLLDLVDAKVLPHFDFTRMTRLAVGKNWRAATPEQQQSLVREFRTLLVRTYSTALATYKDETIEVRPLKLNAGDTEVTVRTRVLQSGGQPVQIDYAMEKKADGWKVFDVTVAGVSLVTNYRSTFDRQIAESGIDGLIKRLAEKNKSLEEGASGKRSG
jgi:phospholipid transport system substrate-binding protein